MCQSIKGLDTLVFSLKTSIWGCQIEVCWMRQPYIKTYCSSIGHTRKSELICNSWRRLITSTQYSALYNRIKTLPYAISRGILLPHFNSHTRLREYSNKNQEQAHATPYSCISYLDFIPHTVLCSFTPARWCWSSRLTQGIIAPQ